MVFLLYLFSYSRLAVVALPAQTPSRTPPAQPPAAAGAITLDQAIEEALAGNLELAAQRYNISIAEARMITARLRPNPVLTLAGDHLDLLGTGFSRENNSGPNEYSIRTDFLFERGGKRADRMAVAAADRSLAELGVRDLMRRVMYDVQSAFVDILQAKESLSVAQNNLSSLQGIVEINRARVRSGDLAEVELRRSEVAALQYQTAVRQAELQLRQAKSRLQFLLGRATASDNFDATGNFRRDAGDPPTLESLRNEALERRPDVIGVRRSQARSQADLRLQIAQGKIDLTAGTEYRRQDAITARGNTLGFFVSAPLPVFNRNQGEIVRAQHELEQSAARIKGWKRWSAMTSCWRINSTRRRAAWPRKSKLTSWRKRVR